MTDSGDVDLHLPLFDDAKGSKVGRLLGSGAAASQGGCVGAVCYNFETGSRGGGGWRRIDTVKSGCPWSKSFNLCQTGGPKSLQICRRRRRRRRERSDRVEHTKKKKSDTARGRKSQKQEKKKRCDRLPLPPPVGFCQGSQRNASPHSKTKREKVRSDKEHEDAALRRGASQPARAETPFRKAERPYAHHVFLEPGREHRSAQAG